MVSSKIFGASSERYVTSIEGQLSLFDDSILEEKNLELIEPEIIPFPKKERKKKPTLKEQFIDIPVRQVFINELSLEDKLCTLCGDAMVSISTELVRSEIVYTPPKFERIEYMATTYSCPTCKDTEEPQFLKEKAPETLLSGSYVSPSLLTYIMYRKYGLFIPLYRQEKEFLQELLPIGRSSIAHWIIYAAAVYLQPMYDFFLSELKKRRFLMMDETPIQVLHEEGRRAQSKSYFWLMRSGEDALNPILLFQYTATRAGEHAKEFLSGMEPGFYLMADGYTGYNKVGEVKRCCCYAHVRRYLLESIPKRCEKDYTNLAVQGVLYCDKLFAYERSYKEKVYPINK